MIARASQVSVIVPAHNCRETIGGAIASVLAGSHRNVQVVVCDDASTDGTDDVVRAIADQRVTLLRNPFNMGPGPSRDRAIDASSGCWITFLDADDAWAPHRLEHMLGAMRGDNDVMVFDDIMLCHQTSSGMQPWRRVHGASAFGLLEGESIDLAPPQWVASSQFVMQPLIHAATLRASGVRHSDRRFQEDTEFFLRLVAAGLRLRYVALADYLYRITPGSLSAASRPGSRTREVLEELLPLFAGDPAMRGALERKITYRRLTGAIRSGDVVGLVRLAARDPGLLAQLVRRTLGIVRYHASRMSHRAAGR